MLIIGKNKSNKDTHRIAFIGCWVRNLAEECLVSAESGWECVTLDEERFKDVRNSLVRKVLRTFEYVRAIWRMRKVDVVAIVFVDHRSRNWMRIAHALEKKCVLYWIGTDVMNLADGTLDPAGLNKADLHVALGEENLKELSAVGVDAALSPLVSYLPTRCAEMPDHHSVLLSIPDTRKSFYGYSDLMRLVDSYPDVEFRVVRSNQPECYKKPNIVFEGMLDRDQMDAVFDRISIHIRWPIHDSMSVMLMEAALKGKYIISRNSFPVGTVVGDFEGLCKALEDAISRPLSPCIENREFALANFTQKSAGIRLGRLLDSLFD